MWIASRSDPHRVMPSCGASLCVPSIPSRVASLDGDATTGVVGVERARQAVFQPDPDNDGAAAFALVNRR